MKHWGAKAYFHSNKYETNNKTKGWNNRLNHESWLLLKEKIEEQLRTLDENESLEVVLGFCIEKDYKSQVKVGDKVSLLEGKQEIITKIKKVINCANGYGLKSQYYYLENLDGQFQREQFKKVIE